MADKMTIAQRHVCMSHIRSRDTKPELIVRKMLHAAGFRFRPHVKKLPGTPDIVLRKYRTAIFINGCFWHAKIRNNQLRDEVSTQYLEALGWKVITVWECELKSALREATLKALQTRVRQNGLDYVLEQYERKSRNEEHRAKLKMARDKYQLLMSELVF